MLPGVRIPVMIQFAGSREGGAPCLSRRDSPEAGSANILLAFLLLTLSLLIFFGWHIAHAPQGDRPQKQVGESRSEARNRSGGGKPIPDSLWEEKTKGWQRLLEESGKTLRADQEKNLEEQPGSPYTNTGEDVSTPTGEASSGRLPETAPSAGPGEQKDDGEWYEVDSLGTSSSSGDTVEIVWSSPDGSVWEKIIDHRIAARQSDGEKVMIRVSPEEMKEIVSAKSRGRVFAVPP